jgi:glycerol kinase
MGGLILAIDQGTTSTRAVIFDRDGTVCGSAAQEFTQHYPVPGWVEHDANEIWQTVANTVPRALDAAGVDASKIAAIGITNQRETVVVWDRATGQPMGRAIVWQDRRTAVFCREHKADEPWLSRTTGLVLDPYFSATKLHWLLKQNPDWRDRAARGELAAGTIDSYLIFRLTGGKDHATDGSNASRTLLLNLQTGAWDDELCKYFSVPREMLPEVRPSSADYGKTRGLDFLPNGLPVMGNAGDQQAALFGQAAFGPGESKCTYGTGAFFLLHTGDRPVASSNRLLTTLAASVSEKPQYALEGSVFIAGAAVQWLRDGLKLFASAGDVERLAEDADADQNVIFVPGFVGLGAPHWIPDARGTIFGLTRNTGPAELARAALEGVAFQVADLLSAAGADAGTPPDVLRVDGGMTRNKWLLQRQADILGISVQRSAQLEATALGAAFLAGLGAGVWKDLDELRKIAAAGPRFEPAWGDGERQTRVRQWRRAVRATIDAYTAPLDNP